MKSLTKQKIGVLIVLLLITITSIFYLIPKCDDYGIYSSILASKSFIYGCTQAEWDFCVALSDSSFVAMILLIVSIALATIGAVLTIFIREKLKRIIFIFVPLAFIPILLERISTLSYGIAVTCAVSESFTVPLVDILTIVLVSLSIVLFISSVIFSIFNVSYKLGLILNCVASVVGIGAYVLCLATTTDVIRTIVILFFVMLFVAFLANIVLVIFALYLSRGEITGEGKSKIKDNTSIKNSLENLKELFDKGIITEEEYSKKRAKYLNLL